MDYQLTNRERNQDAARHRMRVSGRGLLTIQSKPREFKPTWKMRKIELGPQRAVCSNLLMEHMKNYRRAR